MNGYLVTFFTRQDVRHHGKPMGEWLVQLAGELDLRGATVIPGSEGVGHDHRLHSAGFFELADQPVSILMTVTEPECGRLFARLEEERVNLFYTRSPVEFGVLGGADAG